MRAECEAIRERERMYRLSAELSGRLAFTADTDGNMLAMSRTFLKLSGIERGLLMNFHAHPLAKGIKRFVLTRSPT